MLTIVSLSLWPEVHAASSYMHNCHGCTAIDLTSAEYTQFAPLFTMNSQHCCRISSVAEYTHFPAE